MSMKPQILSINFMCPKGDVLIIPFWDGVEMYWAKKQVIIPECPNCKERHVVQLGSG